MSIECVSQLLPVDSPLRDVILCLFTGAFIIAFFLRMAEEKDVLFIPELYSALPLMHPKSLEMLLPDWN